MKLNSLKQLVALKPKPVATANSKGVVHTSFTFKDRQNKIHFVPAAEYSNNTQVLEGKKIGGFNSSRLKEYLIGGYRYSESRKQQINKPKQVKTEPWQNPPPHIQEQYMEWNAEKFLSKIVE